MVTHGDLADALEAAGQAMMASGGISHNIGVALGCMALEFAKKHEFTMKHVFKDKLPLRLEDMKHDYYDTGDPDAPDAVKDRNGEVVLLLCRKCNKGEAELGLYCEGVM